jgi:hypothetical protein
MLDGLSGDVDGDAVDASSAARDGRSSGDSAGDLNPPVDAAADPGARESGRAVDASTDGAASTDASGEFADVDAVSGCPGGCRGNGYCVATECVYPSCIARFLSVPTSPSAVYPIDPDGPGGAAPFRAFCEMTFDGGGWTLVLKVNGTRATFLYDSPLWQNANTFQPESPNLDTTEAKLAGFATIPFEYLRVGMVQDGGTRWLILPMQGSSLMDLMATGSHATTVGRSAWRRLLPRASLQLNCNREGINVQTSSATARIGIISNNQNDCLTCQSWVAFGAKGVYTSERACGNYAPSTGDDGSRNEGLFGFVMVR